MYFSGKESGIRDFDEKKCGMRDFREKGARMRDQEQKFDLCSLDLSETLPVPLTVDPLEEYSAEDLAGGLDSYRSY